MELFKESKKQPIKLRNFNFVGYHNDYANCCYYVKNLPRDNFELMEMLLEGVKKPEIGAGTKVQVIDAFMSNYLDAKLKKEDFASNKEFIERVVKTSYNDLKDKQKEGIIEKFTANIPSEIEKFHEYFKKYTKQGFRVLYCSDDEAKNRIMGIVNIVLVKDEVLKSTDKNIKLEREYTIFKPLKYMVRPNYTLGKSNIKYYEEELPQIVINHDILK